MRTAYLLTVYPSERSQFSKRILERVGFQVIIVRPIPHKDRVVSNKLSMQMIYRQIALRGEYAYVFEDDINLLEDIHLDEIIEYEAISPMFFYLGVCEAKHKAEKTDISIRGHTVYQKKGVCRGLHAIGISPQGASALSKPFTERYMDVILEQFSILYPANVCRYDLESYISGHRGIFFQDRKKFPSMISKRDLRKIEFGILV
jgi:hypothetical protein